VVLTPDNFQNGQAKIEDIHFEEAVEVDTETGEIKAPAAETTGKSE
jgi:hypothetical protein